MKKQIEQNQTVTKPHRSIRLVRIWRQRLGHHMFGSLLALQIIILFVLPPVRALGMAVPHIAIYGTLLAFITMAITLSRSRVAIITLIFSVILTAIGIILRKEQPDLLTDTINCTGQVLTQLSLLWVGSTAVFGPGRITYHRILGAVVMYLSIGMIFINLDILLARNVAGAFTHLLTTNSIELRESLTYFSFSTLTTGSFGDISPVHPIARSLANIESICGQLFPATLLARVVGLHASKNAD